MRQGATALLRRLRRPPRLHLPQRLMACLGWEGSAGSLLSTPLGAVGALPPPWGPSCVGCGAGFSSLLGRGKPSRSSCQSAGEPQMRRALGGCPTAACAGDQRP
eukprot:6441468-Alexandrium_andersonii.AAC.1